MELVPYFAYGTTQRGFAHHRRLAGVLGEPVGRFCTASAHAVVVPREAACSNPGCRYIHQMAALVPGFDPLRVEGDLFLVSAEALEVIDELETGSAGDGGPYLGALVTVDSVQGTSTYAAQAYQAREPARWRQLVAAGRADALTTYPRELAPGETFKQCCIRTPGHDPPHDVIDPLAGVRS
jgi:gamma-glutamylcyclotransferase (GGCT)/AIG2-like uncharacterized protein YtfP